MCGRYALGASGEQIYDRFGITITQPPLLEPRYNVAPSQTNPVVVQNGTRRLALMQWGLVPAWADSPRTAYTTINARAETLTSKPAYRGPLRKQRCLVPATGFYEWQVGAGGKRAPRQAFHMQVADGAPGDLFAFAGLYDTWRGPDGTVLQTYTIITTEANPLLAPIHARMPVILPRAAEDRWLDPAVTDPADLLPLLVPYPPDQMVAYPVGAAVNAAGSEGPDLLRPLAASAPRLF